MRWTPHALVLLGVLLVLWGLGNVQAGVCADGLGSTIRRAAADVEARMSEADMRHVFEMPEGVADRKAWFENYCRLNWCRVVQRATVVNSFGSAALGLVMCVWGIAEGVRRGRRDARKVPER